MHGLPGAAPGRAVFQDQLFACAGDLILKGEPIHAENQKISAGLQHIGKQRRHPGVVEIPEALAGGDPVKGTGGEIYGFGGGNEVVDVHPLRQDFCLFDLIFRNVCPGPPGSVACHIPGQNAGSGAEVKDTLTGPAQSTPENVVVEDLRIDIPVSGVVL